MSTSDELRKRYYAAVETEEATETLARLLRDNADLFRPYPDAELHIHVKDGGVNVDSGGGGGVFSGHLRFTVASNTGATYRDSTSGYQVDCYYLDTYDYEDVR